MEVKLVRSVRAEKDLHGFHPCARIDVQHPALCCLGLGKTQGGVEGQELPVQVGQADGIIVHQGKLPHTGPGQGFHRVAADTAQAEDGNVGLLQPGKSLVT